MRPAGSCAEAFATAFADSRHLCIGLDTDPERIPSCVAPGAPPAERVVDFNTTIVSATADIACAYKPNLAFYEGLGADGWLALEQTLAAIRRLAPGVPAILDAKRGDIGTSNAGYVTALLDILGGDAVTVHPYFGREALEPFLSRAEAMIFVISRSSNQGARELQDWECDGLPLYRHVARSVAATWNTLGNCGLVVGATYVPELTMLRQDVPATMPFLIPGIGHQGGDLEAVVSAHTAAGSDAFILSVSRSILFASNGEDFAEAARREAKGLHGAIQAALG